MHTSVRTCLPSYLLTYLPAYSTYTPTYFYVHAPGKIRRVNLELGDVPARYATATGH